LNLFPIARNVKVVKDEVTRIYERLLVVRCQAGDKAALGELIARYSPGLRFFLRRLCGQEETADDLLQETWIDVYRKIDRLQRPDVFAAWLYRIARDKAYRELRRPTSRRVRIDENLAVSMATEEAAFTAEEAENVRAALDELSLEQRDVLVLRFIEEMSYEQIAEVIARPVGTVRSRIHYAKLALRAKLELTINGKETLYERARTRQGITTRRRSD
jgi:RNA polymerase sigma-70 factor (ECF subfamily)